MINKDIILHLQKYADSLKLINKLLVGAYVAHNNISVKNNTLIISYCSGNDKKEIEEFNKLITKSGLDFTFEVLIQLFEITIPTNDIIGNGAVYTPEPIKTFIVNETFNRLSDKGIENCSFADISCGAGAFLFNIAEQIHKKTQKQFSDIYKENIFGLDISGYSIERTKILFSLLALHYEEDKEEFDFNLFIGNALAFEWNTTCENFPKQGFDAIVGNPPYVRAKNLTNDTKKLLKNWEVTKTGNPDLYIPFFEIALKYLNSQGVVGYITVNTFKRSVNARGLRDFFHKHKFDISILDFGNQQVFDNKSTYTCIIFISPLKTDNVKYNKVNLEDLDSFKNNDLHKVPYKLLDNKRGWLLNDSEILKTINLIENAGATLGDKYKIRNGLATLNNDIFIFKPVNEDEEFYYLQNCTQQYKIEKGVCKDIIKPNRLKTEDEIPDLQEKIIFPYKQKKEQTLLGFEMSKPELLNENYFKETYPFAYKYLEKNKDQLLNRDKGKKVNYKWYEFGRTQALADYGKKLLFPYMSNQPYFVFTENEELLFYAGYAIFSNDETELLFLKKILQSKLFWYYIQKTSKPYASNYYALAKNYVKDFSIYEFNNSEKRFIIETNDLDKIDRLMVEKYKINPLTLGFCDINNS